jgi:hypothetical protein
MGPICMCNMVANRRREEMKGGLRRVKLLLGDHNIAQGAVVDYTITTGRLKWGRERQQGGQAEQQGRG